MWEPVGPLPAAVYWRRRCVALAVAVMVVALVLATAGPPALTPVPTANRTPVRTEGLPDTAAVNSGSASSTSDGAPGVAAAEGTRDGAGPGRNDPTAVRTTPAGAAGTLADITSGTPATPGSTAPATPTATGTPPPSGTASARATTDTTTERIRPDDTPRVPESTVAVPPTGPVPCTNAMLSAVAELDHAVHRVGSHPVLRLVITNVADQPCVRDLDSARQEIVVWSADGRDRLWSSNDCVNVSTNDLRTLLPGRPVAFAVTWGERTTTPGCRTPRTPVPAGTYRLMVRLDNLISPPTPFIRTP